MNLSGSLVLRNPATKIFLRAMKISSNPFSELDQFKLDCQKAHPRYKDGEDRVRFQLESDESLWPEEVIDATLNLAGFLNMCRGETPLTGKYDLVIALGGARRSPLHRACYAAQAVEDQRAETKCIVIAGSTRLLQESEKPIVQDFAPGALNEYDLCNGAAKKLLGRYPGFNVQTVCKDDPRSGNIGVIDEVMLWHTSNFPNSGPISVAGVTTRIYTVGLHLDLARAAKRYGWSNFLAAGHSTDPETVFNRTLTSYLAECLTTLSKAADAAAMGC